jgi:hypothetical protein
MEEDMRPYVESHGGQVDALIREEGAGHGLFSGCVTDPDPDCTPRTADNLGPSLPLLFEYIESFPETPPTASMNLFLPLVTRNWTGPSLEHDGDDTCEQFQDYGTVVYNTVEHGTIEVQIEGMSCHVETERY